MKFDTRQTNIAKGVAVLLLLWHHVFYNQPSYYTKFQSLFTFKGIPAECFIADYCRVCVSIFLILSGYGLYKSYLSYREKHAQLKPLRADAGYVRKHLAKLLSGLIFVYIIFVPMGFFLGRNPLEIYGGSIFKFLTDLLGLSYLFFKHSATMNPTWWFMSIILVYYLVFPLLARGVKRYGELLLAAAFILSKTGLHNLLNYLPAFLLGMYVAENNLLERLYEKLGTGFKRIAFSVLLVGVAFFLDRTALFGFAIIVFCAFCLQSIPVLNKVLEFLRKNSAIMFLSHTFIFLYYFPQLIYGMKYSPLVYLTLVVTSCLVAVLLRWLQHLTRYDKLTQRLSEASHIRLKEGIKAG